jgi:hypothetical protein
MSAVQLRGGVPYVERTSVPTAGRYYIAPFATFWMKFRNKGANIVRLYFTEENFTDDVNYVELPVASATYPYGEWEGPVEVDTFIEHKVWMKAMTAAVDVEWVAFQRRG